MGRNKPLTGRKRKLQLTGTRKLEGSPLSGKGIYTQPSNSAVPETDMAESESPPSAGQSLDEQPDSKLKSFMKVIHTLGSRDDIVESSVNETGPVAMVSSEMMTINQQPLTDTTTAASSEAPPTFWHQVVDTNSNHPYYWNPVTNEVSWILPQGGVISYGGVAGGDEQGEPLDYFAYYDEGIVVPDRKGKGRGKIATGEGEGGGESSNTPGKEKDEKADSEKHEKKQTSTEDKKNENETNAKEDAMATDTLDTSKTASEPTTSGQDERDDSYQGEVSMVTKVVKDTTDKEVSVGPLPPPGYSDRQQQQQGTMVAREQHPNGGGGTKRRLSPENEEVGESQLMPTSKASSHSSESVSPPKKVPRSSGSSSLSRRAMATDDKPRKSRSTSNPISSKQEQQALRFQVSSLADELSRKLQFLHVSIDGLADMQILQVQVKTRISDWEEGGLDTKFLLSKLKCASEDLQCYEIDAAPKGWRFLWDSTSCRYRFQHLSTGEIRWDYPSSIDVSEDTADMSESSAGQEEEEEEEQEEDDELADREEEEEEEDDKVEEETVQSPPPSPVQQAPQPPPPPPSQPPTVLTQKKPPPTKKTTFQISSVGTKPDLKTISMTSKPPTKHSAPVAPATKKSGTKSAALPHQVTRSLIRESVPESQRQGSKSTDLATPTGAYLGGGEMVPAPMPRSWKYESDDLNRRVRREGSIERREDVAEKEISPSDVRRKLAKRLLPVPHSKRGSKGKPEDDDPSELPPSPPTTTAHSTSVTVTTDKQKREKTVVVETAPSKQPKGSTPSKASTPSSEVPTVVSTPSLSNVPLGPSLSSSDGPAAATGGEESEAKLRERLIERAKRFRTVVKETQNVATVTESQKTVQTTTTIEESTGLVYPHKKKDEDDKQSTNTYTTNNVVSTAIGGGGSVGSTNTTAGTAGSSTAVQGLIKPGYLSTLIQVSYDRVEPETGESENIAVVDDNMGVARPEHGRYQQKETESTFDTAITLLPPAQIIGDNNKSSEKMEVAEEEKEVVGIERKGEGVISEEKRVSVREEEIQQGYGKVEGEREEVGTERVLQQGGATNRDVSETQIEGTKDDDREVPRDDQTVEMKLIGGEEGEISSGSSTPGPGSESQTVITPRCYMDKDTVDGGGVGTEVSKREEKDQSNQGSYDSDGRYNSASSLPRRRSRSKSRSLSPSDRYGGSRSSRHRHGDNSGDSNYGDGRYLESGKRRRYSTGKRRRGDNYSDRSGSEYSGDERYSRRGRRDDYDSDGYRGRDRSKDRRSRKSRTDEERSSSRRHKHRSTRSRSRSKESRSSGKHRHRDRRSGSSSAKKKKRDKKDKKHKKSHKDDNTTPKAPKKVTVGKVGKVSSLRTLSSDGAVEGGTDTPLDKLQATIADTIDEKRKQEKVMNEKREESRRLEDKIQQHVQQYSGRSQTSSTPQAQTVSGSYPPVAYPQMTATDLSQAGYYSYAGYQYPQYAAGQGWGGAQWGTTTTAVPTSSGSYQQHGMQYGVQQGMGEQQYGNASVGTGSGQYGTGTANASKQQQYAAVESTGDNKEATTPLTGAGDQEPVTTDISASEQSQLPVEKDESEQKHEESEMEHQNEKIDSPKNMTVETSQTEEVKISEPVQDGENQGQVSDLTPSLQVNQPQELPIEQSQQLVNESPDTVTRATIAMTMVSPVNKSQQSNDTVIGEEAITQDVKMPQPPPPPSSEDEVFTTADTVTSEKLEMTEVEEKTVKKEIVTENEEISECEMEIDSGENSPVELVVAPSTTTPSSMAPVSVDATPSVVVVTPHVVEQTESTISSLPSHTIVKRDDDDDDGGEHHESSPEPLPPGVEMEHKTETDMPVPPTLSSQTEGVTKSSHGNDVVPVPDEIGTSMYDEPAPPGMELESTVTTVSQPPLPNVDPPPLPRSEVTEVKPPTTKDTQPSPPPLPKDAPEQPSTTPPTQETNTSSNTSSESPVTTSEVVTTTTGTVATGTSAVSMTTTPQAAAVTTPNAYYATPPSGTVASPQGYDIAAAAAAYAHATKTGQPYQYPQQQYAAQQSYSDYATYTAYLQQMSQYGGGGGYVLGADGQYYQQASPYAAYAAAAAGAYGGYYPTAAYSYGATTTGYQTAAQQIASASTSSPITTTSTTTADTDKKEKSKKGDFALSDSKEKHVKDLISKWSSFKES